MDIAALAKLVEQCSIDMRCSLCGELFTAPHTFRACNHTFCWDCVVPTLEGPGITESQCPTCRIPAWKRELCKNWAYIKAVASLRAASELLLLSGSGTTGIPALTAGCDDKTQPSALSMPGSKSGTDSDQPDSRSIVDPGDSGLQASPLADEQQATSQDHGAAINRGRGHRSTDAALFKGVPSPSPPPPANTAAGCCSEGKEGPCQGDPRMESGPWVDDPSPALLGRTLSSPGNVVYPDIGCPRVHNNTARTAPLSTASAAGNSPANFPIAMDLSRDLPPNLEPSLADSSTRSASQPPPDDPLLPGTFLQLPDSYLRFQALVGRCCLLPPAPCLPSSARMAVGPGGGMREWVMCKEDMAPSRGKLEQADGKATLGADPALDELLALELLLPPPSEEEVSLLEQELLDMERWLLEADRLEQDHANSLSDLHRHQVQMSPRDDDPVHSCVRPCTTDAEGGNDLFAPGGEAGAGKLPAQRAVTEPAAAAVTELAAANVADATGRATTGKAATPCAAEGSDDDETQAPSPYQSRSRSDLCRSNPGLLKSSTGPPVSAPDPLRFAPPLSVPSMTVTERKMSAAGLLDTTGGLAAASRQAHRRISTTVHLGLTASGSRPSSDGSEDLRSIVDRQQLCHPAVGQIAAAAAPAIHALAAADPAVQRATSCPLDAEMEHGRGLDAPDEVDGETAVPASAVPAAGGVHQGGGAGALDERRGAPPSPQQPSSCAVPEGEACLRGLSTSPGKLVHGLVGRRILVKGLQDLRFYAGTVTEYLAKQQRHRVMYDDGDLEVLNLDKYTWRLEMEEDRQGGQMPAPGLAGRQRQQLPPLLGSEQQQRKTHLQQQLPQHRKRLKQVQRPELKQQRLRLQPQQMQPKPQQASMQQQQPLLKEPLQQQQHQQHQRAPPSGLMIATTMLTPAKKAHLNALCTRLRGAQVMREVTSTTTHVITRVDDKLHAHQRSKTYLLGLLQGVWVLHSGWLVACEREGAWVDEVPFLVKGDSWAEDTPTRCRELTPGPGGGAPPQPVGRSLFAGRMFHLQPSLEGGVSTTLDAVMRQILITGGGVIVEQPPPASAVGEKASSAAERPATAGTFKKDSKFPGPSRHHIGAATAATAAASVPGASPTARGAGMSVATAPTAGGTRPVPQPAKVATSEGLEQRTASTVMVLSNADLTAEEVGAIRRRWGGPPHLHSWMFDCVSHLRILPTQAYVMTGEVQGANVAAK